MAQEAHTPEALPEFGFIRLKQVLRVFPVSKTRWYEGVKAGIYPAPVKLSARSSAWAVEDIKALIQRTKEGRTSQAIH